MRFLVDNQLPPALARHLTERGHDAVHVADVGLDEASDQTVWTSAIADDRVVVSKDEDFFFLANRPNDPGRMVWVRLGNCRTTVLLAAFDRILDAVLGALESGQRIVELT